MNYLIILYFILSFLLFFFIGKISYKLNLVDFPNERKSHFKKTANTGGIAISFTLILSLILFDNYSNALNLILSISFLIALVGFIDDKFILNPGEKICLQIIPILYLIIYEKLTISSMGDYNYFKLNLGSFEIPFTLLCVLLLINSFNYFDGLDGTLSFATLSVFANLFFLINNKDIIFFFITILIPITIFIFFNFSLLKLPKMFLGDGGSLLLGFIISFSLIYLAKIKFTHPILLAWTISIFIYEFISVNIFRIINNKGIFKPAHDHLHDLLMKKFKLIFFTNFIIVFTNIIFFLIGYLTFKSFNQDSSLIIFILLFIIYVFCRKKFLM